MWAIIHYTLSWYVNRQSWKTTMRSKLLCLHHSFTTGKRTSNLLKFVYSQFYPCLGQIHQWKIYYCNMAWSPSTVAMVTCSLGGVGCVNMSMVLMQYILKVPFIFCIYSTMQNDSQMELLNGEETLSWIINTKDYQPWKCLLLWWKSQR